MLWLNSKNIYTDRRKRLNMQAEHNWNEMMQLTPRTNHTCFNALTKVYNHVCMHADLYNLNSRYRKREHIVIFSDIFREVSLCIILQLQSYCSQWIKLLIMTASMQINFSTINTSFSLCIILQLQSTCVCWNFVLLFWLSLFLFFFPILLPISSSSISPLHPKFFCFPVVVFLRGLRHPLLSCSATKNW